MSEAHFALHDEPKRQCRRRCDAVVQTVGVLLVVIVVRLHLDDDVAVLVLGRARQPAAGRRRAGGGIDQVDRSTLGRRQRRRRHGLHPARVAAANQHRGRARFTSC